MSEQAQLFPHICEAVDDKGTRCENNMTAEEVEQDGMCSRCADEIWTSMTMDVPFIMKDPNTREYNDPS